MRPQKKVWALVHDFSAMQTWHPNVQFSTVEIKPDEEGASTQFRTLQLINGGTIVEKQRITPDGEMKLGTVMVGSDMAVSNYSDSITVKPSETQGDTVVTWMGRFNNKANLMQAPAGQDDAVAIAAVETWIKLGLEGLKTHLESNH